jgi:putative ABC transport system permease protein
VLSSSQLASGQLQLATNRLRAGGWIVLSHEIAREHGLKVGDVAMLPAPHPISVRVAALSTNMGWSPGSVIMNSSDYARAWASSDPSAYEVRVRQGQRPSTVRAALQREINRLGLALTAETAAERVRRHMKTASQGLSRLTEIRVLVLIAAVLAVTGALAAMIWQRRDLVAFIKCQGYCRETLWRWLLLESALLLAAGCFAGTVFGLCGQVLISHALAVVTGFPIVFSVGPLVALSNFALVTIAAVTIMAVTGFLVVRVPPRTVSPAY